MIDGGFGYSPEGHRLNIAIMPLLMRQTNLIIICDSSMELKGAPSLRAAEELARHKRLKFPRINYDAIDTTHASMHVDENDLDCPIIVYMPCIRNLAYDAAFDPTTAPFADTFNFVYKPEEAKQLMGLIEFNVEKA